MAPGASRTYEDEEEKQRMIVPPVAKDLGNAAAKVLTASGISGAAFLDVMEKYKESYPGIPIAPPIAPSVASPTGASPTASPTGTNRRPKIYGLEPATKTSVASPFTASKPKPPVGGVVPKASVQVKNPVKSPVLGNTQNTRKDFYSNADLLKYGPVSAPETSGTPAGGIGRRFENTSQDVMRGLEMGGVGPDRNIYSRPYDRNKYVAQLDQVISEFADAPFYAYSGDRRKEKNRLEALDKFLTLKGLATAGGVTADTDLKKAYATLLGSSYGSEITGIGKAEENRLKGIEDKYKFQTDTEQNRIRGIEAKNATELLRQNLAMKQKGQAEENAEAYYKRHAVSEVNPNTDKPEPNDRLTFLRMASSREPVPAIFKEDVANALKDFENYYRRGLKGPPNPVDRKKAWNFYWQKLQRYRMPNLEQ